MSNSYEGTTAISGVTLDKGARIGAVDFREKYNELMANFSQKKKMPPIFGNGFAGASVNEAALKFNG